MKIFSFAAREKQFFTIILILTLSSIATDLYAPSFSEIAGKLATDMNGVQWSVSLFVFAVALSHLFYGPLSEIVGRKKVLILGLGLASLGSFVCVFSISIWDLLAGRVFQGFGVGACAVLWRSIFRDKYEGDELAEEVSYLAPIALSAIILAPFLGGVIQTALGWRANFAFLLFHIIFVTSAVFFWFEETKQVTDKKDLKAHLSFVRNGYKELLSSRVFMGYSFCCFLGFGAFFVWTVSAPVLLLQKMGVTPFELGKIMLFAGLPMGAGGVLNGKIVKRFGSKMILRVSWLVMSLACLFIWLTPYYFTPSPWLLAAPIFVFTFLSGFVWPNLFSCAFQSFGHISGIAASLYGLLQLLGGAFFSSVLSIVQEESQIIMGAIMFGCMIGSILVYELIVNRK